MPPTGKGETRVHVTSDPPSQVISFYDAEMLHRGWKETLRFELEGGVIWVWEKGDFRATVIVGLTEKGETMSSLVVPLNPGRQWPKRNTCLQKRKPTSGIWKRYRRA